MSGHSTSGWRSLSLLPEPATGEAAAAAGIIPADALVLLVGAAGAGKSTWAAARVQPSQVLSSDAFRELVADDASDQGATGVAFQLLHLVARARLERGLLTVIDATNLTSGARRPWRALAERHGRPCVAVLFDVPLPELLARNAGRERVVDAAVVRRHAIQMQTALRDVPGERYRLVLIAAVDP